jgi:DNA (cytosine-5)-methyltransferase 1
MAKRIKRVLNLYSGIGGNRKHWEGVEITAIESDSKIAEIYSKQYPNDEMIVGDAHSFLESHHNEFDFIWTSPPCQTHSKMAKCNSRTNKKFPDFRLYEEIVFLQNFHKGLWIVENVNPFYKPLIEPTNKAGRHRFWANFEFECDEVESPKNFINMTSLKHKQTMMDWLGIYYEGNVYCGKSHCPLQVMRNCVHPKMGKQIFDCAVDDSASIDG